MKRWVYIVPLLAAGLCLLPHVFDAHFGLLDDAVTILLGRIVVHEPLSGFTATGAMGRFFPGYPYHYAFVRLLAGENAAGFYFLNLVVLCLIVALMIWTAQKQGGSAIQGGLSGLLFVCSVPVATAFHTLSKAEVPQALWLAAAVAVSSLASRWALRAAVAALCILLALWSKETSYAVGVTAAIWFLAAWVRLRSWRAALLSRQGVFLAASTAGSIAGLISWRLAQPTGIARGTYGGQYQVSAERMVSTGWDLAGYLARTELFLLPVLLAAPFVWRRWNAATRVVFLGGLIWAACFLGILAPWPAPFEYHLVPACLGLAAAAGFGIPAAWNAGRVGRVAALASLAIVPLHVATLTGAARTQMAIDRANAMMVDRLAAAPRGARTFINMPDAEYVAEARLHLRELLNRPDVQVGFVPYDQRQMAPGGEEVLIASPKVQGLTPTLIRVGYRDPDTGLWAGMLDDFLSTLHPAPVEAVLEAETEAPDFGFQKLLCFSEVPKGASPCRDPGPLYTKRTVKVRWTIYRYVRRPAPEPVPARFLPDGTWEFRPAGGAVRTLRFGERGDVPFRGDFDGDGLDEIGIFRPADLTWRLDLNMDGQPDRVFRLAGMAGSDVPVTGDWDGDRRATPGYFRAAEERWALFNDPGRKAPDIEVRGFGGRGDIPVTGDWFAEGRSKIGFYRGWTGELILRKGVTAEPTFQSVALPPNSMPVIADWSGMGKDTAAWFKDGKMTPRPLNSAGAPFQLRSIPVPEGGVTLAGNWKRVP